MNSINTHVDEECVNLSIPAFDHLIAVLLHNFSGLLPSIGPLGVLEELFPCIPVFLASGKQGGMQSNTLILTSRVLAVSQAGRSRGLVVCLGESCTGRNCQLYPVREDEDAYLCRIVTLRRFGRGYASAS